ncbi:MAG: hypothetical protein Q9201_000528 [Fulgogasparrea decipioides]
MSISRQDVDFELGIPSQHQRARLEGYPSFAHFIARDSDAAIYRKYSHLSARNLLYLQSELHELEERLKNLDKEDGKDTHNEQAQKAARNWNYYSDPRNERACQHRALQKGIREKIKEYRMLYLIMIREREAETNCCVLDEAILLESRILALNSPSSRTLHAFKRWFNLNSMPKLWGRDQHLFDDEQDLVALAPVDNDRLNLFLRTYFGWFFRQRDDEVSSTGSSDFFYYPQRRIHTAGALISIFFSAILLVGAIVCLLLVAKKNMHLRVGMIVLFTSLFALVVGLITNARRAEIFGATAA